MRSPLHSFAPTVHWEAPTFRSGRAAIIGLAASRVYQGDGIITAAAGRCMAEIITAAGRSMTNE